MTTEDVLAEFKDAGALLEGHFILSSGLRSPVFLQKALVFRDGLRTERLCKALANDLKARIDVPVTAIVLPVASSAAWWAWLSIPMARPLVMVNPARAR